MAITNAQQYQQILQKMREAKAFGGVMGLDGRRAYVGGSYGDKGGYQGGGDGKGGKAGGEGTGTDGKGGTGGEGNNNNNNNNNQFEINRTAKLKAEKAAIVEALKSESVDDGVLTSLKEVEDANEAYVVKYGVGLGTLAAHQSSKVSAYELARGGVTDFTTAFAGE